MKFYVASQARLKEEVQKIQSGLIAHGHTITFDWTRTADEGGEGILKIDWRGSPEEGTIHALRERAAVIDSDVLILLLGREGFGPGSFIEFGIAAGLGIETWVIGRRHWTRDSVFFWLPNVMHFDYPEQALYNAWIRREDRGEVIPYAP